MSKYIVFNKQDLSNKILDLLKIKDKKFELEAEINKKIKELEEVMKSSIADTPNLAVICSEFSSGTSSLDFKFKSKSFSTQSQVIKHYIDSLVGGRCLNELGWEFTLNSTTFQDTILNYPVKATTEQLTHILHDVFVRYLKKVGELKSTTKIKLEAFSIYVTPRIVADITNLLYRLTNQDKYFVWLAYFDKFENEFFKVESKGEYVDDEDISLMTFTFTNEALNLLNEALKTYSPKNQDNDDDQEFF